ncbi:MAG: aconitate hydratase [Deltaproteobacteria bacterium]|nr:aconitate hydratase [Deltaproteobacteria bacterium]
MSQNITQKILSQHLVSGKLIPGEEIAIKVDHVLLQDATGTIAMLEFEAIGVKKIRTELAVQYVDHNLLQTDFKNADDHAFLQTCAANFGIVFSRPGNGICHQVHFENFGVPGKTMLGADSHTTTAGGLGMIAIGAGGLDAALAMAGQPFHLICPKVFGVKLTGRLPDWVSAKDVILEMLRRHSVKGGLGKVIEYYGPGVETLSATDRATICNMGAELGATTSIFPSDKRVKAFLGAQGRGKNFQEIVADKGCSYDDHDEIDLTKLVPLIACPTSPDNVVPVAEIEGTPVHQVIIGSSVNSSFRDLMVVCEAMKGRKVHPNTVLYINPGSRQVLENVTAAGGTTNLIQSGASIYQSGCLGCIGIGQAPGTGQNSLRTFPRNFPGRSGTKDDRIYLCSPETGAAAAIFGVVTDPRKLKKYPRVKDPKRYTVNRNGIIFPQDVKGPVAIVRGPNIKPFPTFGPLPESLTLKVHLKAGDNISTDAIMPAGNRVLPFRSNIEAMSQFVFDPVDPEFPKRCKQFGPGCIIGGENYGQGSSREHAAIAPRYLGICAKIVKSFARIHKANLFNFGILPLTFRNPADYDTVALGDMIELRDIRGRLLRGEKEFPIVIAGREVIVRLDATDREREELVNGGLLNTIRDHHATLQ